MSRNAYALFEKKYFWKWGGDMRCSSEMGGGHQTIIKNGGGVHKCRRKWGGDPCAAEGRPKKGTPPSGCFLHLPLAINIKENRNKILYTIIYEKVSNLFLYKYI